MFLFLLQQDSSLFCQEMLFLAFPVQLFSEKEIISKKLLLLNKQINKFGFFSLRRKSCIDLRFTDKNHSNEGY